MEQGPLPCAEAPGPRRPTQEGWVRKSYGRRPRSEIGMRAPPAGRPMSPQTSHSLRGNGMDARIKSGHDAEGVWCDETYCGGGEAEAEELPAEEGFTDLIQAMIFHMSSSDLMTVPICGIGPTTFSEPLRL
jgi:hypothetical protein